MPQLFMRISKLKILVKWILLNNYFEFMKRMWMSKKKKNQHILECFCIPSELSKHDKRYNISHVDPNARLREYKDQLIG